MFYPSFWFFKQLFYALKKVFKHTFILLFIFLIIYLILFVKPSLAYDNNGYTIIDPPTDVLHSISALSEYLDNQHNYFIYYADGSYRCAFLPKSSTFKGRFDGVYGWYFNETFTYTQYFFDAQGQQLTFGTGTSYANSSRWAGRYYGNEIVWRGDFPMYNDSSYSNLVYPGLIQPYITTESNTIINFSFNYLTILAPNLPYDDSYELRFTYPNINTIYTGNIDNYKTITNDILTFNIPKSWFTSDIVVRSGSNITFDLISYHRENNAVTSQNYSLGLYTLSLTAQEEEIINQDSDKQVLSDINKNQQQTNEKLDNIENTLTDSEVKDDSIFLPTIDVQDPTQVGVNQVFDILYNSFTSGDDAEIVLPFPFTNQVIRIPGNSTYNFLHNNGGGALINIIRAFWWYKIASFIAYDVFAKVKVIQEGNIEDMQKDNIKGDML